MDCGFVTINSGCIVVLLLFIVVKVTYRNSLYWCRVCFLETCGLLIVFLSVLEKETEKKNGKCVESNQLLIVQLVP